MQNLISSKIMTDYDNLSKEELIKMLNEKSQKKGRKKAEPKVTEEFEFTECQFIPPREPKEKCPDKVTTPYGFCTKHARTVQAKKAREKYEKTDVSSLKNPDEESEDESPEVTHATKKVQQNTKTSTKEPSTEKPKSASIRSTKNEQSSSSEKRSDSTDTKRKPESAKSTSGKQKVSTELNTKETSRKSLKFDDPIPDETSHKKSDHVRKQTQHIEHEPKKSLHKNEVLRKESERRKEEPVRNEKYSKGSSTKKESSTNISSSTNDHKKNEVDKQKRPAVRTITIRKNNWGRYEEPTSGLVFNDKKVAYGIQESNGRVSALKREHVALCKKNKWLYNLPYDSEEDDSEESDSEETEEETSETSEENSDENIVTSDEDSDDSSSEESSDDSDESSEEDSESEDDDDDISDNDDDETISESDTSY